MSPRMRRVKMSDQGLSSQEQVVDVERLKQWFQIFYRAKEVEGLRPRTLSDHERLFDYFLRFLTRHHLENEEQQFVLNSDLLRSYVLNDHQFYEDHPWLEDVNVNKKGLSPVTINIRLRSIKCLLKFLHTEQYMPTDISTSVKLMKTERDTIPAFTEEQVKALLAQPDQRTYVGFRDYVLMIVLLDTGARIAELLAIAKLDFDPSRRKITIPANIAKNTHARVVPLSRETVKLVQELVSENSSAFPGENHLFLGESGKPLTSSGVRQRLHVYEQRAGVQGVRTSPHTFRHTMTKFYIMNGGDVFSLQRLLDHSTMDMVRRYIQLDTADIESQHQTFSPLKNILKKPRT